MGLGLERTCGRLGVRHCCLQIWALIPHAILGEGFTGVPDDSIRMWNGFWP